MTPRLLAGPARLARLAGVGLALGALLPWAPVPPTAREWGWPLAGRPAVVRGFEAPAQPWLPGHRGVDLLGSPGDAVLAAGPGRVSFAGRVGTMPVVVVTHADGRRTTYQPVVAAVHTGEGVTRGAVLGRLTAAGSHCLPRACLHWGLRRADAYLDPLTLVGGAPAVRLLPMR